jgi:hypothetical protein
MHALTATVRRIRIPAHPDPPTRITRNYSRNKQKQETLLLEHTPPFEIKTVRPAPITGKE